MITEGIITDSRAFEVLKAAQVIISSTGVIESATNSYQEMTLEFLEPAAPALVVGRTDLHSSANTPIANGTTLRLNPGKYRWTNRLKANPGGTLVGGDLTGRNITFLDDSAHGNSIGSAYVSGNKSAFMLVRPRDDIAAMCAVQISCTLPAGDRLSTQLVIEDVATGNSVAPQPAVIQGPTSTPLRIEAAPYFLRAGRLYKITHFLDYAGSASISATISASG